MRTIPLTVAILLLALPLAVASGAGDTVTESYTKGFVGDLYVHCGTNEGGVCIPVDDTVSSVTVGIQDVNDAGGYAVARDAAGNFLAETPVCFQATLTVPTNAVEVAVYANGPLFETITCDAGLPATSGTVTAVFS